MPVTLEHHNQMCETINVGHTMEAYLKGRDSVTE